MITEKMINPLAACIVNRKCVIKRFSDHGKQDLAEVRTAYLEMAQMLIQEYYSLVASGSTDYYRGANMLSQAAYAARQASSVKWAMERRRKR